MENEKLKSISRIIFLKKFTEQIIFSKAKKHISKKNIKVEKLKRKLLPSISTNEVKINLLQNSEERKSITHKAYEKPEKKQIKPEKIIRKPPQKLHPRPLKPAQKPNTSHMQKPAQNQSNLTPMQKIDPMLSDKSVQTIECPGPNKNLLVKRYNKINITKTVLSQEEIKKVIDYYSEKARIPLAGGIFKASVNDVIISAIDSEFAGSRFIINKLTPYSVLEN